MQPIQPQFRMTAPTFTTPRPTTLAPTLPSRCPMFHARLYPVPPTVDNAAQIQEYGQRKGARVAKGGGL